VNREQFLKARETKIVSVDVPEFGVVKMRELPEDDFPTMRQMPSAVVTRLADVAMSLAGLSDEDIEAKLKKTSGD
jgi:hypothetical protein